MDQIEGVIAWDVPIRPAVYSWFAPVQPAWGDCEVVDAAELGHQVPVLHSATLGSSASPSSHGDPLRP
jgi:hypothetical protein